MTRRKRVFRSCIVGQISSGLMSDGPGVGAALVAVPAVDSSSSRLVFIEQLVMKTNLLLTHYDGS